MNAGWTGQQREWLQALGHELLVPLTRGDAQAARSMESSPAGERDPADSPLLRALLRAAARRDASDLAWLPDLAGVRGDPAAKRRLWPRLRALRRPRG